MNDQGNEKNVTRICSTTGAAATMVPAGGPARWGIRAMATTRHPRRGGYRA
ncbi:MULTISPECIES: hypothetical protein [Propionibacterium]|uniref:hypothetical protein n=1 Tax=Propionibacterium TaxID=1743 RepID=UPI0012D36C45|nr:hypothetical protein [Propionibacterium freudenreichii]MDN6798002.1 hypothetical protein [Propionibacterium sp.]MCQ1997539.1 hypothetical protein [Propionibacterium freudenreichii]MDK9295185.1 hypothetical protein [Propionibacterium freudenreichii]MDK9296251.1 hypothetical protein [Propionibacterium freudenreichii]MDK9299306.1 hypothetical protein [Propionibacterium freudenreichii]